MLREGCVTDSHQVYFAILQSSFNNTCFTFPKTFIDPANLGNLTGNGVMS